MEKILEVKSINNFNISINDIKEYIDNNSYIKELLSMGRWYGENRKEFNNKNNDILNFTFIDITKATHRILDYFLEDGKLKVKINIIDERFKDGDFILVPRILKNKNSFNIITFDIEKNKI